MNKPFRITKEGIRIMALKGRKSKFDIRVKYKEPGKRERTPKHIHLAVDLLIKRSHQEELTRKLCKYLVDTFLKVSPLEDFPPKLQLFKEEFIDQFKDLNEIGDYSAEFLLVVGELIMIQEITNRCSDIGHVPTVEERRKMLAYKAYNAVEKDIFSVISAATYRSK